MLRKQSAQRIPDVDPKGPAGVALTDAVQIKLRQFLGADYVDRSLAQYVVVMLAHKTEQHQVAENLVEFLGEVDAKELASWLFESLDRLLKQPEPKQAQQRQQAQQQQQQQQGGGAAAAEEAQEHDGLELEMEQEEGSEGEGGSDADTAELALDERRASGEGGAARRLASAIVQDEYRRRDDRRARSRSRSRSPRRRRSHSPPRGRRPSPPRRRSPPPPSRGMYWEGPTGNRYMGHDPYPFRMGSGWRGREHSPPRRRESPPPYAGRGHGHWGPPQQPWGEPPGLPRGAYMDEPWARPDGGSGRDGGGGSGVFARLQQQQQHYQHDVRWQDPAAAGPPNGGSGRSPGAPPPGLAAGMPVPGQGSRRPMSAVVGSPSAVTMDLSMAHEALERQQQQQQQVMLARAPGQAAAGGSASQELPPWERPAYMDLELQRQQQEQQEQQQAQQSQQVVRLASPLEPPTVQQQRPGDGGLSFSLRPAAVSGHRGAPDPTSAAAFARALTEAAASLGLQGRSVATVPLPMQQGGGQQTTFQITIAQGGEGGRTLSAPLLHQPALQEVLKQRLRTMQIELVKLRAEQAERFTEARRRQELSTAAKLDLTVRSVCLKNVHPAASERVLIAHFGACGFIERITFLREPSSGRKTGVAYLQFSSAAEAQAALGLDGSALLQRTIQVVPSDSPAARVAVSRALRSSYPPAGLVPVPVPMFAAPMPPPAMRYGPGRLYNRSGGRGGRGGPAGRGHGSFKYVRPADQPAPGSAAAGPAAEPAVPGAPGAAAAAAPAAGHGGHENGGEHMAE